VIDGLGAARCLYLTNDAVIVGFTLTNGWAFDGGGVYCESTSAVLSNCVLTGNSGWSEGGGAYGGTLNNCTLTGNSGGAVDCTLNNCTLRGNSGGGAYSDSERPCTLNNCTLTGNSGWGAWSATLNNCIVYFNSDPNRGNYDSSSTLNYCCTTPLPTNGVGNITADPQLADPEHLSAGSPCRGAGSPAYASGTDIDGEPWANPPSIGCDEFYAGAINGPLSVAIWADYTNVVPGFALSFTAQILGHASANCWDFGDGTVVSNRPYASHAWMGTADYRVILRAYNDTYPGGVAASATVHVMAPPVHYVALSSRSPVAPYGSWATAATNIQNAVDAASVPGALVVVSNGVYQTGVAVDKPLVLRSVNGPRVTAIDGLGTAQCLYLTNDAVLVGFTLTNGVAGNNGGGVYCESTSAVLSNCVLTGNSASYGGGAYGGTLNNCTLTGNTAWSSGGGACGGTLNNCTLSGNSAPSAGGGAESCTLNNCTLTGNSAQGYMSMFGPRSGLGGGADYCTLNNCTLTGNSAQGADMTMFGFRSSLGGGADYCTLNNCTLTGNSAGGGGGAADSTLNNCTLSGNAYGGAADSTLNNCVVSGNTGVGADGSTLNNCTVTGNSGGGALFATLNNCIVYFNSDPNGGNYDPSCTLNYCCTTPMPTNGVGNISADPQLASALHLSAESPCIGAGSATYASGTDIDGEAWANPPSIGCDEYHAGAVTGPLTVGLTATLTNVSIGFPVGLTAFIEGRTDLSVWEFGDGFVQVNEPYTSHAWTAPGAYLVALWAFNDSYPGGVSATVTIYVDEGVHYVAATSANPVAPYTSWATAATNIQDAVDVAGVGGTIFVANGTYAGGGRTTPSPGDGATNRVALDKPLTVRSVNGPGVTVIQGQAHGATNGDTRCVYLTSGATLVGFTLTNGVASDGSGGGVYCEPGAVVSNCVLTGNSSSWGGGAIGGTLNNCTLTGNSANGYMASWGNYVGGFGGGAYGGMLNNCTLTGNSAEEGGGAFDCTLNNCIVYFNTATNGANFYQDQYSGVLTYCCTTPMPTNGVGNITNAPLFVDQPHGNLRLQTNSPCINAGNNAYVVGSTDLDGRPRIVGGTVDMGAYEFQGPGMGEFIGWLQQYGLPTEGSADYADTDGNGMNNWQKWIAGLNPTNALAVLKMTSATPTNNADGLVVTWESVNTRTYYLQSSTNLAAQPAFSTIQSNIVGQAGTTTYTDTTATNAGPYFYRVGVGN
jgi:hypothetical protein